MFNVFIKADKKLFIGDLARVTNDEELNAFLEEVSEFMEFFAHNKL